MGRGNPTGTSVPDRAPFGRAARPRLRLVYFGTPDFAVPALKRLAAASWAEVALVVTQPDRPAGRGRRPEPPPVKRAADALGLPLYQPATLRDPESRRPLSELGADLFVVAAFGLIFGSRTLALPRLGCVNLHASLLPAYRCASPIPAALLAGETRTGVTLMLMDSGLDTGPILAASELAIAPGDTTASLTERLALLAADLAETKLPAFAAGELQPRPQPATGASLTRSLTKADGWLDWSRPAEEVARRVRAMWPWPRAWTTAGTEPLQVHAATPLVEELPAQPGTVIARRDAVLVACGTGALRLDIVQPAGGRPMTGPALLAGRPWLAGARLGEQGRPSDPGPLVVPVGG